MAGLLIGGHERPRQMWGHAGREEMGAGPALKDASCFAMTTESLTRDYPLYATSLFNLIKTSEGRIGQSE